MSFTDQKPRIATEDDLKGPWLGGKNGEYFRCGFCGYRFQLGDYWRFVFTNDISGPGNGNPLICKQCDDGATRVELRERFGRLREEADSPRFWSFRIPFEK